MRKNTVVTYQLRREAYDEHVALIQGVFAQLAEEQPDTVEYEVWCLADGVSFVHISTHESDNGDNPLPTMSAFQKFGADISGRVATAPNPTAAATIGQYRGLK